MSNKTENVDVAFQMITEAVDEYAGFVLGIPEGSVYTRLSNELPTAVADAAGADSQGGGTPSATSEETIDDTDSDGLSQSRNIRHTFSNICDRTNGGHILSDIGTQFDTTFNPNNLSTYSSALIAMVHTNQALSIEQSLAISGGSPGEKTTLGVEYTNNEMRTVLKYINPRKFSGRTVEEIPVEGDDSGEDGAEETERVVIIPDPGETTLDVSPPEHLNRLTSAEPETKGIHKEQNPSLGAVVIKDPIFGFNSRNANHLPVFLSAVTPLEMSRCAPFLDVKILTENRGTNNKLGIHSFLRFEAFAAGEENVNFEKSRPVGEAYPEVLNDVDFNYMDIFTSPQTLVNPEVNNTSNYSPFMNAYLSAHGFRPDFIPTKIRDPMQPLMTLISFNPTITGIGHGLMATKKASLKVKLHDKSRIKDLSALLSPNEFASTKFVVEFGWSHPDSDVTSRNTLGKYLNALRDVGVYQLVNADYSFGNDNSVDITLNLVCTGFQQMKSISAAAGFHTGLDIIIEKVQKRIEYAFNKLNAGGENSERAKKIEEIRGELKISNSDLGKNSTLIPFEKFAEWNEKWKDSSDLDKENINPVELLGNLIRLIYNIDDDTVVSGGMQALTGGLNSEGYRQFRANLDRDGYNAGDVIYAKFRSLNRGIDPFRAQVVRKFYESRGLGDGLTEVHQVPLIGIEPDDVAENGVNPSRYSEDGIDNHVSLGKIVSMFVGYPMSTAGLYDEVQLFFYPVNAQAAGARKHTTASFPINLDDLQEEIDKRMKAGEQSFRNLSVHGFFAMLERIVSNQTITAYSLFPEGEAPATTQTILDEFRKKSFEDKFTEANGALDATTIANISAESQQDAEGSTRPPDESYEILQNKIITEYETQLAKTIKDERDDRLRKVYDAEQEDFPNYFVDKTKFVPVNLSMYFETFTPRNGTESNKKDLVEQISQALGNPAKRRETVDNGKDVQKVVLRIHIYDENSNMGPDVALYGAGAVNMSDTAVAAGHNLKSYEFVKNLLMRRHPTIIHGASTGVVSSISVASNTSGTLSNILMVEAYEKSLSGDDQEEPSTFDETVLLPTTVNLEMMGFPMLARGQQIFIDFGTQTSLDNLYTVKTIDHEIQAGQFKTSAILVAANQMIVSSFRSRLESLMEDVSEFVNS